MFRDVEIDPLYWQIFRELLVFTMEPDSEYPLNTSNDGAPGIFPENRRKD